MTTLALATRAPNLKANLHVDNGTYGTLISFGAVGGVLSMMVAGQIVDRIGVGPVLITMSALMYGSIISMPHIHTPWIYLIVNIAFAFGLNAYNIALHHQSLRRQELSGERTIPRMHGAWSLGTLISTVLSIIVTSHVSLAWHIDVLVGAMWVGTLWSVFQLRPFLISGSEKRDQSEPSIGIKSAFAMLTTDRYIAIAYLCAVMVEFSTNNWVTLSSHQEIKASTTLSIVPYLMFMLGMTTGRLNAHRLVAIKPEAYWIRVSSRIGGTSFILFLLLAKFSAPHSFAAAFTFEILGFFIGGLCGSFFAGFITQIASQRSNLPAGVVVAQLGLAISALSFVVQLVISWVAQSTTITYALMIPGALMIALSYFKKLGPREVKVQATH
jgi:MFS family permease